MTHGARLIDSTPPTRTTDASPVSITRLPCIAASRLEPQSRLIVAAGTLVGRSFEQPRHPCDVAVVLTGLVGIAEQDIVDPLRVEPRGSAEQLLTTWAARSSGRTPARPPP